MSLGMNLMLRSRRVFWDWKRRVVKPIPKEPGNPDVAKSRPITLPSVCGKLLWAIIAAGVALVWDAHRLLQLPHYGFVKGNGTAEPLIIAALAAVLTAYGTSEEVLGTDDGVFECQRGYAQGCTTSAAIGWTSTYDILLSLQNSIGVDIGTFCAVSGEDG